MIISPLEIRYKKRIPAEMKRTLTITGVIVAAAFLFLFVFNKFTSKKGEEILFAEAVKGEFEISITTTGELVPEKSVDILGPEFAAGRDIRATNIKIQDLIPEGTLVEEGDFVATLDRTELNNSLKDAQEYLTTINTNLEVKVLDTAVVLNELRDMIKNQKYIVEEAAITLRNSKYESPSIIRQAEIDLDKNQRVLEQRERSYVRRLAQVKTDIYNQNYWKSRIQRRINDLEEVLAGFTVKAPASGMVIYKKERRGNKRKIGSTINPMDRVVATLPDLTTMLSKTYVNEIDINKVKNGQRVNVAIDAFPQKAFKGSVISVANIGEKLPNTNDKVFEVQIKIDGTDPALRPSMTTGNKIIISTTAEAVYIPQEAVHTEIDSIPFVYTKKGNKQIVVLGKSNDKFIIVEQGLNPGAAIYIDNPAKPEKFKLAGEELLPVIREREKLRKAEYTNYSKRPEVIL